MFTREVTRRKEGTYHIVNGAHVDGVVGDTDNGSANDGDDPVDTSGRAPCEDEKTNGQAWRSVHQPPHAAFEIGKLIIGSLLSLLNVAANGRNVGEVGDEVAKSDCHKGQTNLPCLEVPQCVDKTEGLEAHEDEGVAEAREERQDKDDWLSEEHLEGSKPKSDKFLGLESLPPSLDVVGSIDLLSLLAQLLGVVGDEDSGSGFVHQEAVENLYRDAGDELQPHAPAPVHITLDEASDDWTED